MVDYAKRKYHEARIFAMQMFRLMVTGAFLGLGLYSIYLGHKEIHFKAKATLLIFAGTIVAAYGLIELYHTLTRKEA